MHIKYLFVTTKNIEESRFTLLRCFYHCRKSMVLSDAFLELHCLSIQVTEDIVCTHQLFLGVHMRLWCMHLGSMLLYFHNRVIDQVYISP